MLVATSTWFHGLRIFCCRACSDVSFNRLTEFQEELIASLSDLRSLYVFPTRGAQSLTIDPQFTVNWQTRNLDCLLSRLSAADFSMYLVQGTTRQPHSCLSKLCIRLFRVAPLPVRDQHINICVPNRQDPQRETITCHLASVRAFLQRNR